MAGGKKLTQLTTTQSLAKEDLIYIIDQSAATGSKSKGIRKDDFANTLNLSTSGGSRLISGGMVWVSGLTYESVNLIYEIAGEAFPITDGTTIVLETADGSNPRIDLGYGDDLGALNKSTGTPAGSPIANTLPAHQFQLFIATIATGASTPTGVSIRTVYTENAGQSGEFDATESTSAARITLGNTDSPLSETKDIKVVTPTDGDLITLVHATATTLTNLASLEFDIKLATDWSNDYLILKLLDNTVEVGVVNINSSFLDITNVTTTQTVNVFKSDFALVSGQTEFDKITIYHRVRGSSTLSYQLDEFYINEDSGQTEPISVTASDVSVDAGAFSGNLSSADDNVQDALETINSLSLGSAPEGTAVKSTGEGGGTKFLREDGDGTSSWQSVAAGGLPVVDTTAVVKGSGDNSKLVRIEADGLTTSTTRVITMPDVDVTLATPTELTKLSNIEASADVTDATNVTNAGALMDSELTSITDVKALDQSVVSGASPTFNLSNCNAYKEVFIVTCSNFETDLTLDLSVGYFDFPYNFTITEIIGTAKTAPTGSSIIADVNVDGSTIITTDKVEIEATEVSSLTATTQPTITDAAHSKGQRLTVDIDQIGSTIAGQDLEIQIIGYQT